MVKQTKRYKKNKFLGKPKLLATLGLIVFSTISVIIAAWPAHRQPVSPQAGAVKLINKPAASTSVQTSPATGQPTTQTTIPAAPVTKQSTGDSLANPGSLGSATIADNVTPVIAYFGQSGNQIEVNAYIPQITETGTCTLLVTNAGATVSQQSQPAHANAQSTTCDNFFIDGARSSTSWQATITYSSSAHHGVSQAVSLQ